MRKRGYCLFICMVLLVTIFIPMENVQAKAKPKLSITNKTMYAGKMAVITLKNAGKVKWKTSKKSLVTITKKKKNKAKKSEPAAPAPVQSPIPEEQVMEEIARAVPVSDMGGWYTVLVLLLGQEKGRELYTGLKSDEDLRDRLSNCLLSGETERSVHLVTLLYRQQQLDTAKAEKTVKIVKAHSKKNKKAVKADMDKCFGKEVRDVSPYYKVIKPVIPILKGK